MLRSASKRSEQACMSHSCHVQMPIVGLLALMEACGVAFDGTVFEKSRKAVQQRIHELESAAQKSVGTKFSLASSDQVAEALFGLCVVCIPSLTVSTQLI